jgi:hypothetical protein
MKKSALEVLLENKKEYTLHLCQLLTEPLYVELQSLYTSVKDRVSEDKILEHFQDSLSKIPHWNLDQVTALKDRLNIRMNCHYFTDLLKASFMVYMKIHLATLDEDKIQSTQIKVKVPSTEVFLHRTFVALARFIWRKPYLMYHKIRSIDKQRNVLQCESYIHKAITQTIQNSLPLTEIFQLLARETHIQSTSPASNSESESETSNEEEESDSETESLEEKQETEKDSESESSNEEESEEEEAEEESEAEEVFENIPVQPIVRMPYVESVGIKPIDSEEESESESSELEEESEESEDEEITSDSEMKNVNMVAFEEPKQIKSLTIENTTVNRKKSHETTSDVLISKETIIPSPVKELNAEEKKSLQESLFNKGHREIHKPKSIHVKVSKSRSKDAFF